MDFLPSWLFKFELLCSVRNWETTFFLDFKILVYFQKIGGGGLHTKFPMVHIFPFFIQSFVNFQTRTSKLLYLQFCETSFFGQAGEHKKLHLNIKGEKKIVQGSTRASMHSFLHLGSICTQYTCARAHTHISRLHHIFLQQGIICWWYIFQNGYF